MTTKTKQLFIGFCIGAIAILLVFFSIKNIVGWGSVEKSNSYIIANQIAKMNKMVVVEQDFSAMRKTKVSYHFLGNTLSENNIVTYTKTNVQVSFYLSKMKIDIDSTHKKLVIKSLPEPIVKVNPNLEIQSMDDSFFNRINEEQIKKVTAEAKDIAVKSVNENQLKTESKKQLMENLNQIFVLAKALNYQIVDETQSLDLTKLLD
jgi:hypothetical protein